MDAGIFQPPGWWVLRAGLVDHAVAIAVLTRLLSIDLSMYDIFWKLIRGMETDFTVKIAGEIANMAHAALWSYQTSNIPECSTRTKRLEQMRKLLLYSFSLLGHHGWSVYCFNHGNTEEAIEWFKAGEGLITQEWPSSISPLPFGEVQGSSMTTMLILSRTFRPWSWGWAFQFSQHSTNARWR